MFFIATSFYQVAFQMTILDATSWCLSWHQGGAFHRERRPKWPAQDVTGTRSPKTRFVSSVAIGSSRSRCRTEFF